LTVEWEMYRGTEVAQEKYGCRRSTGLLGFRSSLGVYGVVQWYRDKCVVLA
jgi:hypothetical protein